MRLHQMRLSYLPTVATPSSQIAGREPTLCPCWARVQRMCSLAESVTRGRSATTRRTYASQRLSRLRCVRIANLLRQFRYVPRPTGATDALRAAVARRHDAPGSATATVGSWKRKKAMTSRQCTTHIWRAVASRRGRSKPASPPRLRRLLQAVAAAGGWRSTARAPSSSPSTFAAAVVTRCAAGVLMSIAARPRSTRCAPLARRQRHQARIRDSLACAATATLFATCERQALPAARATAAAAAGGCGHDDDRRHGQSRVTQGGPRRRGGNRRDLRRCRSGSRPERCQGPHDRCATRT